MKKLNEEAAEKQAKGKKEPTAEGSLLGPREGLPALKEAAEARKLASGEAPKTDGREAEGQVAPHGGGAARPSPEQRPK